MKMFEKMFLVLCLVAMMFSQAFAQRTIKTCTEARVALDAQATIFQTLQLQRQLYQDNLVKIHSRIVVINNQLFGPGFGDCQECQDLKQDLLGQLEDLRDRYELMKDWLDSQDTGKINEWLIGKAIQAMDADLKNANGDVSICTDVYYAATGWLHDLAMKVMGIYLDRISLSNNLLDDADALLDAAIAGCKCPQTEEVPAPF